MRTIWIEAALWLAVELLMVYWLYLGWTIAHA